MTSESNSFIGDMEGRDLNPMAFRDFLSLSDSREQRQHYLAQVPIRDSSSSQDAPLKDLWSDIKLPDFLLRKSSPLEAVNFWMASRQITH